MTQVTSAPRRSAARTSRRSARPPALAVARRASARCSRSLIGGFFLSGPIQDRFGEEHGRGAVRRRHPAGARGRRTSRTRGSSRTSGAWPNSDVEEGIVFAQDPIEGTRVDKETVVSIDVSSGKPEVHGSERRRPVGRGRRRRAHPGWASTPRSSRSTPTATRARSTAQSPGAGHRRRRGNAGPDQRLEGPEAGDRPERRRPTLRPGRLGAPAGRIQRVPNRRRLRSRRGHRRAARTRAAAPRARKGSTVTLSRLARARRRLPSPT